MLPVADLFRNVREINEKSTRPLIVKQLRVAFLSLFDNFPDILKRGGSGRGETMLVVYFRKWLTL